MRVQSILHKVCSLSYKHFFKESNLISLVGFAWNITKKTLWMRSMCFSCPSDQLLLRNSIKSKRKFNICSIKLRCDWIPASDLMVFDYCLSDNPEVWRVEISSGHGQKEVKTTWQISTNAPVEHGTSNNSGGKWWCWNEIIKAQTSNKFGFYPEFSGSELYIYFLAKAKWYFAFC